MQAIEYGQHLFTCLHTNALDYWSKQTECLSGQGGYKQAPLALHLSSASAVQWSAPEPRTKFMACWQEDERACKTQTFSDKPSPHKGGHICSEQGLTALTHTIPDSWAVLVWLLTPLTFTGLFQSTGHFLINRHHTKVATSAQNRDWQHCPILFPTTEQFWYGC